MPRSQESSLTIGRRIAVHRPGAPAPRDGRIAVLVPRGAFGSGEHETTMGCLELLEALPGIAGARVLDLGSGTGILGVAAVMLGAHSATCVDIDLDAVAVSRETAVINRVADRVHCVHGRLGSVRERPFDVALANLYADVLVAEASSLCEIMIGEAPLILSGIAWEQAYDVRRRYEQLGCRTLRELWGEGWVTLRLNAPQRQSVPDSNSGRGREQAPCSGLRGRERSVPRSG